MPHLGLAAVLLLTLLSYVTKAQNCPDLSGGVVCAKFAWHQDQIEALFDSDRSSGDRNLAALAIRAAFHAAGTFEKSTGEFGSNGGTLRLKNELDNRGNSGVELFINKMEPIFDLAQRSRKPISHADLYTLAGAVAVQYMGGPIVPWRPGRTDKNSESDAAPDGTLPMPNMGPGSPSDPNFDPQQKATAADFKQVFAHMGLSVKEGVALTIGGHAIGGMHPDVTGFTGHWTEFPFDFSNDLAVSLVDENWQPVNPGGGPLQYAPVNGPNVQILPCDFAMKVDPEMKRFVRQYARNCAVLYRDFKNAFAKLLNSGFQPQACKANQG